MKRCSFDVKQRSDNAKNSIREQRSSRLRVRESGFDRAQRNEVYNELCGQDVRPLLSQRTRAKSVPEASAAG